MAHVFADLGMTLTVDNVDCSTIATRQPNNKNETFHWSLGFATKNRITSRHMGEERRCNAEVIIISDKIKPL